MFGGVFLEMLVREGGDFGIFIVVGDFVFVFV